MFTSITMLDSFLIFVYFILKIQRFGKISIKSLTSWYILYTIWSGINVTPVNVFCCDYAFKDVFDPKILNFFLMK